jgi:hypothetical protein
MVNVIQTELKIGKIRVTTDAKGKVTNHVLYSYEQDTITMSYAPTKIDINGKQYILNFPLRCLFEKEDDYFVVQSEMLDIVGTGETKEAAELSFKQEFDYIYTQYNKLENNQLSERLLNIKYIMNNIVKQIIL